MKVYSIIFIVLLSFGNLISQAQNKIDLTPINNTYNHYLKVSPFNILKGEFKMSYEHKFAQANRHSLEVSGSYIAASPKRNRETGTIKGFATELQYRYDLVQKGNSRFFIGGYGQQVSLKQDYVYENRDVEILAGQILGVPFFLPKIETNIEEGTRTYNGFNTGFLFGFQGEIAPHITAEISGGFGKSIISNLVSTDKHDEYLDRTGLRGWANSYRPATEGRTKPRLNFTIGYAF